MKQGSGLGFLSAFTNKMKQDLKGGSGASIAGKAPPSWVRKGDIEKQQAEAYMKEQKEREEAKQKKEQDKLKFINQVFNEEQERRFGLKVDDSQNTVDGKKP